MYHHHHHHHHHQFSFHKKCRPTTIKPQSTRTYVTYMTQKAFVFVLYLKPIKLYKLLTDDDEADC